MNEIIEGDVSGSHPSVVKVSVVLPENVHRQLKLASVQRRVSIQKVMEDAAQAWIAPPSSETDVDPLYLSHYATPTPKEIGKWLTKCRRILESGHKLAILGCTSTLDAMDALVQHTASETRG